MAQTAHSGVVSKVLIKSLQNVHVFLCSDPNSTALIRETELSRKRELYFIALLV